MTWRPLTTAIFFAVFGPAIGFALTLAFLSPAIVNLGPYENSAFWELAFGVYVIGAPPLAATGFLAGVLSRRGTRVPSLTFQSAVMGFVFGGLSALFWGYLGSILAPSGAMIFAIAVAGAVAGFGAAVLRALSGMFAR
jgi:hypothetical protein